MESKVDVIFEWLCSELNCCLNNVPFYPEANLVDQEMYRNKKENKSKEYCPFNFCFLAWARII